MNAPLTRPVLRYHGGKWRLAPWIINNLPPHRIYVEPFGGAASVLLRKDRSYGEIYNDLSDEVVGLFRVLRDPDSAALLTRLLTLTPFARVEFTEAYEPTTDPVERARRLIVRSYMGFGSDGCSVRVKTGFRSNSNRSGTTPAHDWTNFPDALGAVVERFRGVVVEHRPAIKVMAQHDSPKTLYYVDPPYLAETRSQKRMGGGLYHFYAHEMTNDDHAELLAFLRGLAGMVVLSGYPSPLYEAGLVGWHRVERAALADGARARTEVLWLNPAAVEAMASARPQAAMFQDIAEATE